MYFNPKLYELISRRSIGYHYGINITISVNTYLWFYPIKLRRLNQEEQNGLKASKTRTQILYYVNSI